MTTRQFGFGIAVYALLTFAWVLLQDEIGHPSFGLRAAGVLIAMACGVAVIAMTRP